MIRPFRHSHAESARRQAARDWAQLVPALSTDGSFRYAASHVDRFRNSNHLDPKPATTRSRLFGILTVLVPVIQIVWIDDSAASGVRSLTLV